MNVPTLQDFIDMCKEDNVETFVLNDEQYDAFEKMLNQEPNPSENLINLMNRKPQWLKS